MSDKYFFDTNILVYANDSNEKEKQKTARSLIKDALNKQNGVISVQVLGEFWVTVTQKIKKPLSSEIAEKVDFFLVPNLQLTLLYTRI